MRHGRDPEFLHDHSSRDDVASQHVVTQCQQPEDGGAAVKLARGGPPVVVLEARLGGSRHRVVLDCEGRQAASRWVRENLAAVRVQ